MHVSSEKKISEKDEQSSMGRAAKEPDAGERYFRSIVEYSHDVVGIFDAAGNLTYIGPSIERVLGYAPEEVIGRNFFELVHPDDLPAVLESHDAVLSDPAAERAVECRFRHKDGTWRLLENAGRSFIDEAGEARTVVNARDVTERKRIEEALRESRETALTFINANLETSILMEVDGKILAINEVGAERLGRTSEEMIGHNLYDFLPEEIIGPRRSVIAEVVSTRGSVQVEDSRYGRIIESIASPVYNSDGEVDRIAIFGRDTTDRKRSESEIRQSRDNLLAFLNATSDYAMLIGADRTILAVNKVLAETIGLSESELVGMDVYSDSPMPTVIQKGRVAAVDQVFATGEPVIFEDERRGRYFEHRVFPVFDEPGEVGRVAFFTRDITREKKAREALAQSEAKYRALVEQLPAVTFTAEMDDYTAVTYVSPQSEQLLGISEEQRTANPRYWTQVIHPDDRERVLAHLSESQEKREPFILEFRVVRPDGNELWIRIHAEPVMDEQGNALFLQGVLIDMTERKRAEHALRDSEERYRLHFENSFDVIYSVDTEFKVLNISPSIERALGYRPEELIGRPFTDLNILSEESLNSAVEDALRIMAGERVTGEYEFLAKDGRALTGEVTGAPIYKGGEVVGYVSVARDITARKEAEEKLRQSEERYRSFYSVSPDFIFLTDRDGLVIDANPAVLNRAGMSIEEIKKTRYMDYLADDDARAVQAAEEALLRGEEVRGLVVKAGITPNFYTYEINSIPLFENGKVVSSLNIARDISEIRRDEEELRRLNRELEGFAQTVSHDLRTPLTAMKLANDTLQKVWARRDTLDLDVDAEIRRFGEVIDLGARKSEALINDLLKLARAGQELPEVSEIDIDRVVARVLSENEAGIAEKGVRVEVDDDLGVVRGNETHLYQLFTNVIDNAIKHNDSPEPVVQVRRLGGFGGFGHRYAVKDNGSGIPEADLRNIFLPFFKGETGETGIGLAIVEKIVKLYGGTIRAYNNGGTTFEFFIRDMPDASSTTS